jgi:hypothetical protein
MEPSVRARLRARGIDPEHSTTAFLLALRTDGIPHRLADNLIRGGINNNGNIRNVDRQVEAEELDRMFPQGWGRKKRVRKKRFQPGIPMAVVLTDDESRRRRLP